jgi:NADH-quinone oxidoreductase subunit G
VHTGPMASDQLFAAVPFYAGLTLDEIGGRGVRWPETPAAASFAPPRWELAELEIPPAAASPNGALRLGTFRPLWAAKEVDLSPVLHFARAQQVVELAPPDAERLGVVEGDRVEVRSGAGTVTAAARLRASLPHGTVFVAAGTLEQPANVLAGALAEVRRVGPPEPPEPSAVPAMVTPAGEGMAEMPASAPQPDPGVRPPSQSSDGSAP